MHLRTLELFCEVAARRSFSKAAEGLGVSQSMASQAVNLLEKRLQISLIDRSKRPLELTPAGQVYFDGCRKFLEEFRHLEDRVLNMKDKVTGRLRVAAIYSVGLLQMEDCLKHYQNLFPEVEVHLDYQHPDEVYEMVLHDEAELGLVSFPREGGEISSIHWQSQPMVLVVPCDHPLAGWESVPPEEIQGEDFVGFVPELKIRKQIDRWFREIKINVRMVHEFDNVETIKKAVEIGSGITLLPAPTIRRELMIGSLKAVPLADVHWMRPLGIVHKRHRILSAAAQKFVDLLLHDVRFNGSADTLENILQSMA